MKKILLITIGFSVSIWANFTRDNNAKIVTDNSTKLQWQDNESVSKKWIDAIDYCEALTLGDYNDWRLPNQNELRSIADRSKRNPAIDSVFKNVVSYFYWSSSTMEGRKSYAWGVLLDGGDDHWYDKSAEAYVRCVRCNFK